MGDTYNHEEQPKDKRQRERANNMRTTGYVKQPATLIADGPFYFSAQNFGMRISQERHGGSRNVEWCAECGCVVKFQRGRGGTTRPASHDEPTWWAYSVTR